MVSPTSKALAWLRGDGWEADVVEKWIPGANIRKDLFGFIDIVGVKGNATIGVQATSYSNVSARVKKIKTHEKFPKVLTAKWQVCVVGFKPGSGKDAMRPARVVYLDRASMEPLEK